MIEKIDFARKIRELNAIGLTCYKIGVVIGAEPRSVQYWRDRGVEPKYSLALLINELHELNRELIASCGNITSVARETLNKSD